MGNSNVIEMAEDATRVKGALNRLRTVQAELERAYVERRRPIRSLILAALALGLLATGILRDDGDTQFRTVEVTRRDVRRTVTSEIKAAGDGIYLLGRTRDELGASEFQLLFGEAGGQVPVVRPEEALALYYRVMAANREGLIRSSHDLSDGGLAVALAETVFGTGLGLQVDIGPVAAAIESDDPVRRRLAALYSESHSRFVVSVRPEHRTRFEEMLGTASVRIGEATTDPVFRIKEAGEPLVDCSCSGLEQAWRKEWLA